MGSPAVKEMYLDRFAEAFVAAGLAALHSTTVTSAQAMASLGRRSIRGDRCRDYRDAITFAETLHETDAERIGIWGSSYSGGHVLVVGAIDRRVKCVVSQVPLISGQATMARRLVRVRHDRRAVPRRLEDDRPRPPCRAGRRAR